MASNEGEGSSKPKGRKRREYPAVHQSKEQAVSWNADGSTEEMLRGVDDGCHSKASRRVALKCDPRWLKRRYVLTQIEERL